MLARETVYSEAKPVPFSDMTPCREIKQTLSGDTQTYSCELLAYEPGFGMLRYAVDREYRIGEHTLRPGDVTHALYWEDRPYTLYVWDPGPAGRLYYFNIADSVALGRGQFVWRDLTIDVLIDAGGRHRHPRRARTSAGPAAAAAGIYRCSGAPGPHAAPGDHRGGE